MAKQEEGYPRITRIKERRQIEQFGKMVWIDETCIIDYGPKMGKTTSYFVETTGTEAEAEANRRNLNSVLRSFGYQLKGT